MKIGIDIDDTISATFEKAFIDAQKFDIEELGNSGNVQNYGKIENHFYIETMYPHWSKEQVELFWTKYFKSILIGVEIKPYAAEVIQKMKEEGNEIFIITSRFEEKEFDTERHTRNWLKEHKIPDDNLIVNVQDKGKISKELGLELFIDDSIEHCRNIQKAGSKTFLMTTNMNQGVEAPDLERVYSWIQIYEKYRKRRK